MHKCGHFSCPILPFLTGKVIISGATRSRHSDMVWSEHKLASLAVDFHGSFA